MALSTWLLGGLGYAVGGPLGALVGAILGAMAHGALQVLHSDDNDAIPSSSTSSRTTIGDLRISLIVLIASVIKADGRVLKSEIQSIKPFLVKNYGEDGALEALQLLKQLLKKDIDYVSVARQIGEHVNYSTRLVIIHMLLEVAVSDDNLDEREENIIRQIALCMHVANKDYESLLALYKKNTDTNWAYTALEIQPSATDDEVKRAYRRMAMKYHPDKVASAGEEMKQKASEKFRAINEAYEHIKKLRNIA